MLRIVFIIGVFVNVFIFYTLIIVASFGLGTIITYLLMTYSVLLEILFSEI